MLWKCERSCPGSRCCRLVFLARVPPNLAVLTFPLSHAFCPDLLRAQASNAFSHFVFFFLVFASCEQERIEKKGTQPYTLMQFKLSSLPSRKVMNPLVFLLLISKCCKVHLSWCAWRCVNLIVTVVSFLKSL